MSPPKLVSVSRSFVRKRLRLKRKNGCDGTLVRKRPKGVFRQRLTCGGEPNRPNMSDFGLRESAIKSTTRLATRSRIPNPQHPTTPHSTPRHLPPHAAGRSGWELLDSRWNGNEALRWTTDRGPFFVKMNRVEDMSVFMTEVRRNFSVGHRAPVLTIAGFAVSYLG